MIWSLFIAAALAQQTRPEFVAVCDKQIMPLLSWSAQDGVQWLPREPDAALAKANAKATNGRGGWFRMGDGERAMGGLLASPVRHPAFLYAMRRSSFAHAWTTYSQRSCRPDDVWITKVGLLDRPEMREAFEAWQAGTVPGQTWISADTSVESAPASDETVAFLLRGEKVHVTRTEPGWVKVAANLRGQVVQGWVPIGRLVAEEPVALAETDGEPEPEETWIAACEYDRATLVGRWSAEVGLEPIGGDNWPAERLGELGRELSRRRWTFHPALDGPSESHSFAAPGVVAVDQTQMLDLGRCPENGIVTTGASFSAAPLSSAPSILADLTEKQDFHLQYPTRQQCGPIVVQGHDSVRMLTEMGCEPQWTVNDGKDGGLLSFIESTNGMTWTAVINEVNGDSVESSIRVDVRWVPGC